MKCQHVFDTEDLKKCVTMYDFHVANSDIIHSNTASIVKQKFNPLDIFVFQDVMLHDQYIFFFKISMLRVENEIIVSDSVWESVS